MIRIIGLIMRPVPNGVAFHGRTLVISKSSNKRGEFFQIASMHFFTLYRCLKCFFFQGG